MNGQEPASANADTPTATVSVVMTVRPASTARRSTLFWMISATKRLEESILLALGE